jgi:hypothetical protein
MEVSQKEYKKKPNLKKVFDHLAQRKLEKTFVVGYHHFHKISLKFFSRQKRLICLETMKLPEKSDLSDAENTGIEKDILMKERFSRD